MSKEATVTTQLLKEMIAAIIKEIASGKPGQKEDIEDVDISSTTTDEAKKIGDRLGVDWNRFDLQEFAWGLEIEYEHTSDPGEAGRIALDHLRELPDYYSRLKKMESQKELDENVLDKMGKKKVAKSMRKGFIGGGVYTEFPSEQEKSVVKKVTKNLHRIPYSHNPPTAPIGSEPKQRKKK